MARQSSTEADTSASGLDQWEDNLGTLDGEDFGEMEFNFEGVEPKDFGDYPTLPDGEYPGRIDKCEFKVSRTSNNPMLAWEYTFTDEQTGISVKVFDYTVFPKRDDEKRDEKAARALKRLLDLDPNFPQPFVPKRDAAHFVGIEVRARLKYNAPEGDYQAKNTIRKITASSAAGSMIGAGL